MEETLFSLLHPLGHWAIVLSLVLNVVIAIMGLVPTWAVTAVNIALYGPLWGGLLSAAGEALGAVVAFYLYRRGFRSIIARRLKAFPRLDALRNAAPRKVAAAVFIFRLVPWAPSGLVTFAAAVSRISLGIFALCSSIGKLPALAMEVLSVYYALHLPVAWVLALALLLLAAGALVPRLRQRKSSC